MGKRKGTKRSDAQPEKKKPTHRTHKNIVINKNTQKQFTKTKKISYNRI